ncbi:MULTISPECIES: M15 family metallopeptidase [unclassified Paenibacillus]|uniref:M15 family metallopeptidase n=1 Tax=unclassified Paenibacillus TaxID=185978 RepID=UPI0024071FC1|nr:MULTISPECIES: M15 family metallopeptidase [unclassified Paenibacillus]MDF9845080.1 D-alanyl-D-alanine carboxypeptidase [Paenibacillus sp. PastF-2]MDF9851689.1 D-alanyl-D-alanine carboxypeptidase [Paenibacillus sp. PastM-2]MDF9858273.1 D-alanyl-D-alanine carboxypeptidase [Paenibacillus sp. PastF-1]MDH6483537.1 D-alanyl-D-alanine carboxypeptidase [Paenibacillus sp. PastH-2]MDH6510939.1 D-alanyl-D-alanine carboxypeptidase [Paenibacillus sp. PastM-3]
MKKRFFCMVLVVLLGWEALHQMNGAGAPADGLQIVQVMNGEGKRSDLTAVSANRVHQGNLLLVNNDYPVHPEGITTDIISLAEHGELTGGYTLLDTGIQLSKKVALQFSKMVEAAGEEGVSQFLISSGYRELEEQQQLYEQKGADYALPPGYSEHNLGLSLDIGSSQMEMSRAPEGRWLAANAWEYGFILRYPKDKSDITGIQYEPWHFRYVGLPHSIIMRDKQYTLEEYLDYLKQQQSISVKVKGIIYQISYFPVNGSTFIPIPAGQQYDISGNNMDGVIVTTHP